MNLNEALNQIHDAIYNNITAYKLGDRVHVDGRGKTEDEIVRIVTTLYQTLALSKPVSQIAEAKRIKPKRNIASHKTGSLSDKLSFNDIVATLGFKPNCDDDGYKVKYSWGFTIDGEPCAIWDYKDARWSTFGPREKFVEIFGEEFVE